MSMEYGAANRTAGQAPALVHVNWREVIVFVLLAYCLAWGWSGFWPEPVYQISGGSGLGEQGAQVGQNAEVLLSTMLTPMIAASSCDS
jgi:hypothetical protein